MNTACRRPSRGFTLVELLVVITIIGMLVAILVPAAFVVLRNARNVRISLEIASLAQAVEAYKNAVGDYPPNSNDPMAVRRHVAKRWQQIPASEMNLFVTYADQIDPAEALVFWLGGPQTDPTRQIKNNPIMPLSGTGEPHSFFEFDQGRLFVRPGRQFHSYAAPHCMNAPFVYFDARSYVAFNAGFNVGTIDGLARGSIRPSPRVAGATTQEQFVNPTTYQIITAGQDGLFGGGGSPFPAGPIANNADRDNIANFTEGKTMEDARP